MIRFLFYFLASTFLNAFIYDASNLVNKISIIQLKILKILYIYLKHFKFQIKLNI